MSPSRAHCTLLPSLCESVYLSVEVHILERAHHTQYPRLEALDWRERDWMALTIKCASIEAPRPILHRSVPLESRPGSASLSRRLHGDRGRSIIANDATTDIIDQVEKVERLACRRWNLTSRSDESAMDIACKDDGAEYAYGIDRAYTQRQYNFVETHRRTSRKWPRRRELCCSLHVRTLRRIPGRARCIAY